MLPKGGAECLRIQEQRQLDSTTVLDAPTVARRTTGPVLDSVKLLEAREVPERVRRYRDMLYRSYIDSASVAWLRGQISQFDRICQSSQS